MPNHTTTAVQQTPYPIGPLSLAEMHYWEANARYSAVRYCGYCVLDVVAWANERKAATGIYPTYGHISNDVRRWLDGKRVLGRRYVGPQRYEEFEVV